MASSFSFTRWAIIAIVSALALSALLILSPVGQLIGVRLAPGLPFRIVSVGENNARLLYQQELVTIEWDVNPDNLARYPGETVALCPVSITRLHRSCVILSNFTPNNGQAVIFIPPHAPLGPGNLLLQAWRTNTDDFLAVGPTSLVPVTVGPPRAISSPLPSPVPTSSALPSLSPSPLPSPTPSPSSAPSPLPTNLPSPTPLITPTPLPSASPSPSPSPILTPSPFIAAAVTLLDPITDTVIEHGVSALNVRLQRFLGSASGLTCESWRLVQPDGTIISLADADWVQVPARLAPPCVSL